MLVKLKNFNRYNNFVLIVNFHNCFVKALSSIVHTILLKEKKFVTQGLTIHRSSINDVTAMRERVNDFVTTVLKRVMVEGEGVEYSVRP